jgi:type I restriction enzyme S subunit
MSYLQLKFLFRRSLNKNKLWRSLDEAFEGIDSAIANTEKNLANARELFESYLNAIFTRKGK